MINNLQVFLEQDYVFLESKVPKDEELKKLVKVDTNKRLIDLSKKYFKENLTETEKEEVVDLLQHKKSISLIKASEKVGKRIGWFRGFPPGFLAGGGISIIFLPFSELPAAVILSLILLGAIAGGITVGFISSKIFSILNRWRTEEEIVSGRAARINM